MPVFYWKNRSTGQITYSDRVAEEWCRFGFAVEICRDYDIELIRV